MTIATHSSFIYGHTVDETNFYLNFNEGGGELRAEIAIGSYTLTRFVNEVALALNEVGTQEYTVSVDRNTLLITISAVDPFDLLITSGSNSAQSAFALMGFTGADLTGLNSYTGNLPSGSEYIVQFPLQRFIDFPHKKRTINTSINKSGTGVIEVVSYGRVRYMECNIKYITNIINQGLIRNNPTGVNDYLLFIDYITQKKPLEFNYDFEDKSIYIECLLESTSDSQNGTDYTIKELYSEGLAYYFESGKLEFSELIE